MRCAHPRARSTIAAAALLCALVAGGCGGARRAPAVQELAPLEEDKALQAIDAVLASKQFDAARDVGMSVVAGRAFAVDRRVVGQRIAIEFVTDADRAELGSLPKPADGSKLHVVPGTALESPTDAPREQLFVLFLDAREFEYQRNPTPENRGEVTLAEVRSRLERDLIDFLAWYETIQAPTVVAAEEK